MTASRKATLPEWTVVYFDKECQSATPSARSISLRLLEAASRASMSKTPAGFPAGVL